MKNYNTPNLSTVEQKSNIKDRLRTVFGPIALGATALGAVYFGADKLKNASEPEPHTVATVAELAQNGCEEDVIYEVIGDATVIDQKREHVVRPYIVGKNVLVNDSEKVTTTYKLEDDSGASIVVTDEEGGDYVPIPIVLVDDKQYAGEVKVVGKGYSSDGQCTIEADSIQSVEKSGVDQGQD